jgi:chromosome segregation ATPase
MTFSHRLLTAALAVLLLGGVTIPAQNKLPGPDLAGTAETRTMHTELLRAIQVNTRAQIVIARLASQDARVAAATGQAADAQRELIETRRARASAEADVRRLRQSASSQAAAERAETNKEITEKVQEVNDLRRHESAISTQLPRFQQALTAEQARRNELSAQLDALERSLPGR